jgi:sialic acid synthase SpsE
MKLYRIKKSDIDKKGRGLYATKDIKKGTKIIDYVRKTYHKKTN